MKQTDKSSVGLYTIGIAALFLAGFFLLVVFGAQSYRNTVSVQDANMHTRALLSYISTSVKANDVRGAVTVRETAQGQILLIEDSGSGYGLKIYRHDGYLLEEYAALDADLRPEEAQKIGETAVFEVEKTDSLLRVTTDAGQVLLRLRSEEGGAA